MATLAQICILTLSCLAVSLALPYPFPAQQQLEDTRQLYQPFRQFQVPASTRLLPNNLNDGVRYGQQQPLFMQPQYLYQQDGAAQGPVGAQSADQGGYVDAFLSSLASGYYPYAADNRPLAQPSPQPEQDKPERLQAASNPLAQQQLYLEQQAAAQAQMQLMQEEADRQRYMLQFYQQRPNSNFVYYSLPQQQQVAPQFAGLSDRTQGFRPTGLNFQRFQQVKSGQEQNNASSAELQESHEATPAPQQPAEEVGPSIAQAKPQAISVAGVGGVAAAAPVGTAVVGPGGMALSAPSATALAGTKPRPGQTPGSRLRNAVQYL